MQWSLLHLCFCQLLASSENFLGAGSEIEPPQLRPSTPVSSRGASTTTSTTVSTPTPTQARRSSMTTTKLHTASNVFRAANRSDLGIGLSPRPATEFASACHLTDEIRPATSAGEKPSLKPEEHNIVENLRGNAGADSLRIDSPIHRKRGVPAKRSFDGADRSVHTSSFHQLEKLISETHVSNEGEDSSVTWNGSRSYRRSSSFEVPADHVQGRFQSYTGLTIELSTCDLHLVHTMVAVPMSVMTVKAREIFLRSRQEVLILDPAWR